MDHYKYSQQIRKQIESNPLLSKRINNNFLGKEPLTNLLGEGDHFKHFDAGNLDSGLAITTKDITDIIYGKNANKTL